MCAYRSLRVRHHGESTRVRPVGSPKDANRYYAVVTIMIAAVKSIKFAIAAVLALTGAVVQHHDLHPAVKPSPMAHHTAFPAHHLSKKALGWYFATHPQYAHHASSTQTLPPTPSSTRYTTFEWSQSSVGGKTYTTQVLDTSGNYHVNSVARDFPSAPKYGIILSDPTTLHQDVNTSQLSWQQLAGHAAGWTEPPKHR